MGLASQGNRLPANLFGFGIDDPWAEQPLTDRCLFFGSILRIFRIKLEKQFEK